MPLEFGGISGIRSRPCESCGRMYPDNAAECPSCGHVQAATKQHEGAIQIPTEFLPHHSFVDAIESGTIETSSDDDCAYYKLSNSKLHPDLTFRIGPTTVLMRQWGVPSASWTLASPEAATAIRTAIAKKLGGVDEQETRLLPAIITMSEVRERIISAGHALYILYDEDGIPCIAVLRPSAFLPLFTARYHPTRDGRYEIPPFDLPGIDTDGGDGYRWRAIHDSRLSRQIDLALQRHLVQQEAYNEPVSIQSTASSDQPRSSFEGQRTATERTRVQRIVEQMKTPVVPCSEVILNTDKPTILVTIADEPDDVDL